MVQGPPCQSSKTFSSQKNGLSGLTKKLWCIARILICPDEKV